MWSGGCYYWNALVQLWIRWIEESIVPNRPRNCMWLRVVWRALYSIWRYMDCPKDVAVEVAPAMKWILCIVETLVLQLLIDLERYSVDLLSPSSCSYCIKKSDVFVEAITIVCVPVLFTYTDKYYHVQYNFTNSWSAWCSLYVWQLRLLGSLLRNFWRNSTRVFYILARNAVEEVVKTYKKINIGLCDTYAELWCYILGKVSDSQTIALNIMTS